MAGEIPGDGMERNLRRVGSNTDLAGILQSRWRIRRAFQTHRTPLFLRQNGEGVGPIVQRSGSTSPVLLVVVTLWQRPNLVTSVVDPASRCLRGRNILSFVFWIDK